MKAAIVIGLVVAACFQVASLVGKGLGVQQDAAATAVQVYRTEVP